jgi:hypothetical protein
MDFKFRKLITNDLFAVSRILKKMDLPIKLSDVENKSQDELGAELISSLLKGLIENICMAQDEVNAFIGELIGLSGEEFGQLGIDDTFEIIKAFKNIPSIGSFLLKAGQLMK